MTETPTRPAYEYIPAGCFSGTHMGLSIYVRYRSNPAEIRLREINPRMAHISCPDRDLWLVGDNHFREPFPVDFSYDEVVVPSPYWPRTGGASGIRNWMGNYTQAIGKESNMPDLRVRGRQPEHTQTIYADSGGFQIQSERFDYLAPEGLIEFYNRNVDIGMVLDFPPRGLYWPGLLEQMGEAQARTSEILRQGKRDDLQLMNVFHGESFEDTQRFRAIVEHPDIDLVAMGGAYQNSIMRSIDHTCRVMLDGRRYPHYHILGISQIRQLYPIMRMATQGIAPYITSDSSTWLQEALCKGYYVWPAVDAPPRFYKVGDKTNRPNAHKILPCSCPVCSAIKYTDIFGVFSGNVITFLMSMHNQYAFQSLTAAMYDIIRDASLKDLKVLLRRQLETRPNARDEVLSSLDYVDEVAANGIDAGAERVQYFLGGIERDSAPTTSIFSLDESRDTADEGMVTLVPEDHPRRVRMTRILDSYIRHSDAVEAAKPRETVRVKKKERIRETLGHEKTTSAGIRIPGQRKQVTRKVKPRKDRTKSNRNGLRREVAEKRPRGKRKVKPDVKT